jgi:hypothetical protein
MPTCGVSYWKEWSLSDYPNNFSTSRFAEPVGAEFKKHQSPEGYESPHHLKLGGKKPMQNIMITGGAGFTGSNFVRSP